MDPNFMKETLEMMKDPEIYKQVSPTTALVQVVASWIVKVSGAQILPEPTLCPWE